MIGIFLHGLDTVDDVIDIRTNVIAQIKAGGTVVTGWSSEGVSMTKVQGMSLRTILEECNAFLQAEDPDTYGRRIKRLRPYYI